MKKLLLCLIALITFSLSACFLFGDVTTHPNMVEYTEEEILEVAKEKYGVTEWIFTGIDIKGKTWYDAEGAFCVKFYDGQFSTEFVNGDNIETAMQAFAGKNGNHDVQGQYSIFLCYVALGKLANGSLKFVYYNTNINKDAKIPDTIGASDYTFEVLPTEINNDLFTAPFNWNAMTLYLKGYHNMNARGFIYSGERLTVLHRERYNGVTYLEFYKENGKVVYDIYHDKNEYDSENEKVFVYSTSNRYGVIYNYYGLDKSEFFDITTTVTQSTEDTSCMTLKAQVKTKDINGTVIYSKFLYSAEYYLNRAEGPVLHGTTNETVINKLNFECGWMLEKIEGIDHTQTAKFIFSNFYIFYEKNA